MLGRAEAGVALTAVEGTEVVATLAVGGILGAVFGLGLVVVAIAAC